MNAALAAAPTRPRVEGEREVEIFEAVVRLVADNGYDKLTYDAVASDAHASKATLYRKWPPKAALVGEAGVGRMWDNDATHMAAGSRRGSEASKSQHWRSGWMPAKKSDSSA